MVSPSENMLLLQWMLGSNTANNLIVRVISGFEMF